MLCIENGINPSKADFRLQQILKAQPHDFCADDRQRFDFLDRGVDVFFARFVRQHDDVGLLFVELGFALIHRFNRNIEFGQNARNLSQDARLIFDA